MSATDPSVFPAYDLWSPAYDQLDNPLVALAERVLAERLPGLAGLDVLELGCGTGRNAAPILAAGARYRGVDGSPGMLAQARARGLDAGFELGDVATPGPGEADVVLFCLVLEHSRELAPLLAAAASRLRPGGRLLALELDAARHAAGVAAHFQHAGQTVQLPSFAHDEAELVGAAHAAGLHTRSLRRCYVTPADVERSAKLARYLGQPLLVELEAVKAS